LLHLRDFSALSRFAETPIHIVCRLGRLDLLQLLCSGSEDVNFGGANGFTALHYAVKSGSLEMVRFLVEDCKADILAEDDNNQTPLELALLLHEGQDLSPIIEFLRRANDLLPSF
jgi:ankyrin repeat protein